MSGPGTKPSKKQIAPAAAGRGKRLRKMQEIKETAAGGDSGSPKASTSEPTAGPSFVTADSRRSTRDVGKVTKAMSKLSMATAEPGESDTKIAVTSNFVRLVVEKDRAAFEYEVQFEPHVDSKSKRTKLIDEALGELTTTAVYDENMSLYLPSRVFSDREEFHNIIPCTELPVKIVITYKRKRKMNECLLLYNVLLKKIMHILLYQKSGRNYFSLDHKYAVPQHNVEVFPGFAIRVDEMKGGPMICLDIRYCIIRMQTVNEYFKELKATHPSEFEEKAKKIIGKSVLTKYNNVSTYKINDVSWEMNPSNSFTSKDGDSCTFCDYYEKNYNITIQDVDQPLLFSLQMKKASDTYKEIKVNLIPELCYLIGLRENMRSDSKVIKDVGMYIKVTPHQRASDLRTWLQRVHESEPAQALLDKWGVALTRNTPTIEGRVLKGELIYFGGGKMFCGGDQWNVSMANASVVGPKDVHFWQLYYTVRVRRQAINFADVLVTVARRMGFKVNSPRHIILKNDRTETYLTAIQNNSQVNTQLAVFVCPQFRTDLPLMIKKVCCINYPMASEVVFSKSLSDPQRVEAIVHKICLQITCKLGGELWNVKIPTAGWMVCGMDMYHGDNQQTVAGFVASINTAYTKYYSQSCCQANEVANFYNLAIKRALAAYKDRLGCFPKKIVLFRNGVTNYKLNHCRQYEVPQILEAIKQMGLDVKLTFVVVQKRSNTKIFQLKKDGSLENLPTGTVVDSVVTRKSVADFFLLSQSVKQGTASPTHYIVLYDNGNTKTEEIQRLAFRLCHLYFNWPGTIRIPAPCMYARKLASMVGRNLEREVADKLNDKLWFL